MRIIEKKILDELESLRKEVKELKTAPKATELHYHYHYPQSSPYIQPYIQPYPCPTWINTCGNSSVPNIDAIVSIMYSYDTNSLALYGDTDVVISHT